MKPSWSLHTLHVAFEAFMKPSKPSWRLRRLHEGFARSPMKKGLFFFAKSSDVVRYQMIIARTKFWDKKSLEFQTPVIQRMFSSWLAIARTLQLTLFRLPGLKDQDQDQDQGPIQHAVLSSNNSKMSDCHFSTQLSITLSWHDSPYNLTKKTHQLSAAACPAFTIAIATTIVTPRSISFDPTKLANN